MRITLERRTHLADGILKSISEFLENNLGGLDVVIFENGSDRFISQHVENDMELVFTNSEFRINHGGTIISSRFIDLDTEFSYYFEKCDYDNCLAETTTEIKSANLCQLSIDELDITISTQSELYGGHMISEPWNDFISKLEILETY